MVLGSRPIASLPYVAWRCLGVLGVGVLWKALLDLMSEEGPVLLRQAYGGEGGAQAFNEAVMVFLPKDLVVDSGN